MFCRRFLSPTDQKYAESSTYWQFFYYRPTGKFRERLLKYDAKNWTYIYIYIYHPLDNQYGFSLSIGNTKNHVATLTCLEWLVKYVNVSIILTPKLTPHCCHKWTGFDRSLGWLSFIEFSVRHICIFRANVMTWSARCNCPCRTKPATLFQFIDHVVSVTNHFHIRLVTWIS